ncbi:hypothetical protein GCM10009641_69980 [Mycobacterium cookii]|uniref:TNase-like domain-containing protein n=1 Tax=Nocardioides furvisabuli TaxID=375542 RepID=A0ABP5IF85_9ACTN|nr:thermonuclease family protein [Nocardioides furvisabuli]
MIKHIARALALLVALAGLATFSQPAQAFYDRDCSDFATQAAAQTFFNNAGPGDPHRLDSDGDGVVCESNPCPCIGRGNPQPAPGNTGGNNNSNPGPALYRETGNVVKVIDGDTLKVRLKSGALVSVRMLGINTPERGRCGAADATRNLRRLAPVRSTVDLVSDRSQAAKDRYGRLLRYVAKRGGFKDLSYRQAYNGYTKRYVFGGKPVARDGQYVRAINQARNKNRGLWNSCW